MILAKQDEIEASDLPLGLDLGVKAGSIEAQPGDLVPLEKIEELHIRRVLERTTSVAEAARVLGIDDGTIYRKRKRLQID